MARIGRELVAQARMLARSEPRRPKQATLRRTVSTAYYGLFHFLISRQDALHAVARAEAAVSAWRQLKAASPDICRLFAMALILWGSLASR